MKKFLLGICTFFLMPLCTLAVNYDIKNFYIDATIEENGDMHVKEMIVLKGSFNGYERDILYKGDYENYNASNIENIKISAKEVKEDITYDDLEDDFMPFKEVSFSNNGSKKEYVKKLLNGGYRYRMYYATQNSKTAFLIEYTLKDVVILHNDCAEIYWNFIGNDFADTIHDLRIRVRLPKKDDQIHWWFHGDLAGESKQIESDPMPVIEAKLDKNPAYKAVDTRLLFSRESVNKDLIKKQDNEDVKESIIKHEDEIVKKDTEVRAQMKLKYNIAKIMTTIYFIALIVIWVYVYIKYDKERPSKFQNEYNREFIDDYNVEVIDYLMNKNITPNAMSASIMNLIYKKNIAYEEIQNEKGKKDYQFTLKTRDKLNETENALVDFLFLKVGKDNIFTASGLKNYASSTKTCNTFMSSYTAWNNAVLEDAKNEEFFENGSTRFVYGIVIFLLSIIVTWFVAGNNIEFIPAFFTIFSSIIFIVYLSVLSKKTEKGIDHYTKWKAFKKFLEDFGTFELKELPEIELWERYLVYATIFGLADKVEKAMNVKIKEISPSNTYYNSIYIYNHYNIAPVIQSSVRGAYSGAQTAITRAHANSSNGSFGGHGGGFSSGGGFGGGGGGGRGF